MLSALLGEAVDEVEAAATAIGEALEVEAIVVAVVGRTRADGGAAASSVGSVTQVAILLKSNLGVVVVDVAIVGGLA